MTWREKNGKNLAKSILWTHVWQKRHGLGVFGGWKIDLVINSYTKQESPLNQNCQMSLNSE